MATEPWTLRDCGNGGKILIRGGSIHGAHPQTHVQILPVEDAYLMASAPELLEALTESLRWIAKVAADHDDDSHLSGQALKMYDKARAAIRKATGG